MKLKVAAIGWLAALLQGCAPSHPTKALLEPLADHKANLTLNTPVDYAF
ncbi:hypothetical protein [Pseudomonas nicosulfuronedens]